jgi:hypothetical protein
MELGPAQISREDGKRRIVVGFNVKGRDVASVVTDIQKELNEKVKLPEGYYYTYGGTFENLQAASKRLMIAVPVALALIFMLLYFTFTSVKQATLIYTAIPMSAIGGVFALLLRDMPFSISAGIGFIALFGVAVLKRNCANRNFQSVRKRRNDRHFTTHKRRNKNPFATCVNDCHRCIIRLFTNGTFARCRGRSAKTFGNGCDRRFAYSNFLNAVCFAFAVCDVF